MNTNGGSGSAVNTTTRCRGLLAKTAAAAGSLAVAGAVFATGASTATAPEPAQLNYDLSSEWVSGAYVGTQTRTTIFKLSRTWTTGFPYRAYVGYPCIDYNAPAGTKTNGYIVNSGVYSRCAGL